MVLPGMVEHENRTLGVLMGLCAIIMLGTYSYVHWFTKPHIADCMSNTPVSPGGFCLDRATGTMNSAQMWNEELREREATSGD